MAFWLKMLIASISIVSAFLGPVLMPASLGTALAFNEKVARYGLAPVDAVGLQADIGRWRADVRGRMVEALTAITVGDIVLPVSVELWGRFVFHIVEGYQQPAMLDLWKVVLSHTAMHAKIMPFLESDGYMAWLVHRAATGGAGAPTPPTPTPHPPGVGALADP